jgi:hypothetical protein
MSREPINMIVSDHVYVKKTLRFMHGGLDPVAQILLYFLKDATNVAHGHRNLGFDATG